MKTIVLLMLAGVSLVQAERPKVATYDYMLPKSNFREVLEITAQIAGKPVVVSSEEELNIQTSLVLPAPIAFDDVRKVIATLLMLEGYELVDGEKELQLKRILTEKQCEALNKALGRMRSEQPEKLPLRRAMGRAGEAPKQWVIVRPPAKEDAEQAVPPNGP
jgi:type II secretory pathway component GspD/PulD (secretin)